MSTFTYFIINLYLKQSLIKNSYKNKINNPNENKYNFKIVKQNNYKFNTIDKCPYCENSEFIKYGFYNKTQRYKCKNHLCGKTFTNEFFNKFRYSKKFRNICNEYFYLLNSGFTIRECAKKLNISIVTSFFWRHRFLFDFKNKYYLEKISSHVELTKMVLKENFKGSRKITDDSRDKIVVINALNINKDIIPIFTARNFFGFYEVRDNIIPRLDKKAYVIGLFDGKLKSFSKAFNEIHHPKLLKKYDEPIDIAYSNNTKKWLSRFRGVATKYLDHYLYFRLYTYKDNYNFANYNLYPEKSISNLIYDINTYISWKNIKLKLPLI